MTRQQLLAQMLQGQPNVTTGAASPSLRMPVSRAAPTAESGARNRQMAEILSQDVPTPTTQRGMVAPVDASMLTALGNIGTKVWGARKQGQADDQSRDLLAKELAMAKGEDPFASELQPVAPPVLSGRAQIMEGPGAEEASQAARAGISPFVEATRETRRAEAPGRAQHDLAALTDPTASSLAGQRIARDTTPQEWSDPYVDESTGALVQRHATTGELREVSRPAATGAGAVGDPAEVRTMQRLAEIGGLNADELASAVRTNLGLEPRAAGGGWSTFRMTGADGRERIVRANGQSGEVQMFVDGLWVTAGAGIGGPSDPTDTGDTQQPGAESGEPAPSSGDAAGADPFTGRATEEEPPEGYRWQDGRLAPIPGSPQERTHVAAQQKRRQVLGEKVPGILRDITRAYESADASGPTAGVVATAEEGSGMFRRLMAAQSPAYELNQHLDSIKSNISIDTLQNMREASPTGGALGQVPVRQQEFLMQVQGALLPTLDPEVLRENLAFVHNNYLNSYLDAIYGDEQEWQQAIADGRAKPEDAMLALQQREDAEKQYQRQNEFGRFGQREAGATRDASAEPENAAAPQTGALPEGVTEEDVQFTMQQHSISREEVLERLR